MAARAGVPGLDVACAGAGTVSRYTFRLSGPIKPYVRMTQRSRFVDPQAKEYRASKEAMRLELQAQMAQRGLDMLPGQTPLEVAITTFRCNHRQDLDNIIKAVLDACNGVVWPDDRWVDKIAARREHLADSDAEAYITIGLA